MAPDNFQSQSAEFLGWFKAQPGAQFHPALRIEDLRHRNAGRGIIATEDIDADVTLFTIPRDLIITVENSALSTKHPTFFDDVEQGRESLQRGDLHRSREDSDEEDPDEEFLDPWLRLILTLMYEFLHLESSRWKEYLDILPFNFETPMFWSEDELRELQASDLRKRIGKASADRMFHTKLVPVVRSSQHIFLDKTAGRSSVSDAELVQLAHRTGSMIMAYAFDLEKDEDEGEAEEEWIEDREGQTLGMVPVADTLNADAEFNAHLNHGEHALSMTSLRPIKAGEEVLNYYGPLPNSDLLRRYGYVSEKHDVHTVVEIPWSSILSTIQRRHNVSERDVNNAISKLDPDELEDSFVLEYDSVSPDPSGKLPTAASVFNEFPEPMVLQTKAVMKCLKKIVPGTAFDELDLWAVFKDSVDARLQEYNSTARQDHDLLPVVLGKASFDQGPDGVGAARLWMAVKVRLGEKELLTKAADFALQHINSIDGEPKRKRVKTS